MEQLIGHLVARLVHERSLRVAQHVPDPDVVEVVQVPLVDGLHDGGHEDLVLRHGLDADRHSVQPLGIEHVDDGLHCHVGRIERSGSVSDLAAGQVGVVVQDGDVVDGEVHCLRRHRYRLAHVFLLVGLGLDERDASLGGEGVAADVGDKVPHKRVPLCISLKSVQAHAFTRKRVVPVAQTDNEVVDTGVGTLPPHDIKCLFNQPNCSEADVDGWSLVQAFIYFVVGLIIPNKYLIIIIVSIILEILKPFIGYEPKYIIGPLLNTTGYIVGSMLSPCKNNYKEKYQIFE